MPNLVFYVRLRAHVQGAYIYICVRPIRHHKRISRPMIGQYELRLFENWPIRREVVIGNQIVWLPTATLLS